MYTGNPPEHTYIDIAQAERDIHTACNAIEEVLGKAYTIPELIQFVKDYLKCPSLDIVILHVLIPLEEETFGMCARLLDGILILLQSEVDQVLELQTLGHEVGHVLSKHVKEAPFTISEVLAAPDKFVDYILNRKTVDVSDEQAEEKALKEYIAEEIGIKIAESIIRKAHALPEFANDLFGESE